MNAATEYRLAPGIALRLAGTALVALALVIVLLTMAGAWAGWAFWPIAVVALAGLAAVAGASWWLTRAAYVVRLDPLGYQVRLVRGAGVKRARWTDVAEVSTARLHGASCVVVALRDGRTTTVPVGLLAGDRDEFATRLRGLLGDARRRT